MIFDMTKRKSGGTIVPKTINANGVYNAAADNADGYSPVTVNVPAGIPVPDRGWLPVEWDLRYGVILELKKIRFYGPVTLGNNMFALNANGDPTGLNKLTEFDCDTACRITGIYSNVWAYQTSLNTIRLRCETSCTIQSSVTYRSSVKAIYINYPEGMSGSINASAFASASSLTDIYVSWGEGEVADAPWGATNATIHYNYTED